VNRWRRRLTGAQPGEQQRTPPGALQSPSGAPIRHRVSADGRWHPL